MTSIGKQAAFYRGYLPDDRSLVPLTVLLSTTLALWLLVRRPLAQLIREGYVDRVLTTNFDPLVSPVLRKGSSGQHTHQDNQE